MLQISRLAQAVLVSILALPPSPSLQADVTIGGARPATLHVPPGYDPQVPAPLLLLLHGCPSDGAGPYGENVLKLRPVAEELGILFAVPDGMGAPGQRSWGGCSGSFVENSAYLRSLIEEAQGLFNIDRTRIFVAGYSDGGFMAYRMVLDHGDLVAAIACLAGANPHGVKPSVPVPILDVHGTADVNVPYADGLRSIEAFVRDSTWAMGPEDAGRGPDVATGTETAITRWGAGCLPEGFFELWTLPGVTHFPALIADGATNTLARNMIDWLLRHPRGPLPVAAMTVVPSRGLAPLEVTADASGSASPAGTSLRSYCWAFGDGGTADGVTATHTYELPGLHAVRLLAVNDAGGVSTRAEQAVTITCPAGDLGPWTAADVGGGAYPGTARFETNPEAGDLHICAAGIWLNTTRDQLLFVHRQIAGDFRLTVMVSDLLVDVAGGFAGAMCRESLGDTARFAGTVLRTSASPLFPGGIFWFRYRPEKATTVRGGSGARLPAPAGWVRLERRGDTFVGEASPDGVTWLRIGEQVLAGTPPSMLVGIAVARSAASASSPAFDALRARVRVELEGPSTPFLRGDSNADGATDLSDAIATLGFLFLGTEDLPCAKSADANDDGRLDVSDPVYLLGFKFLGGPEPPAPFAACGADAATPDELLCAAFAACP